MPELPEVETIRRDLLSCVVGRTFTQAWVSENAPRLVQLIPPGELCRGLVGRRIADIRRRGKYLLFDLDRLDVHGGLIWAVHLRMTGRLLHKESGCSENDSHLRAAFRLDDGTWLCFVDQRKFGMMWLVGDESLVTSRLGPEPLGESFDPSALRSLLKRRSAPVKSVLLDQTALAGIGNIYADEALFAARINPGRPAGRLSRQAAERLHASIVGVLQEALGDRGSSFRDYVDGRGNEGGHHLKVKVFRRTDQPCYACGTLIRRIKVGGRSTHFCPKCQR
jgi:formamidopyrimidine-DNA glycosylase